MIVPELYCSNFNVTLKFYLEVLEMDLQYERLEEKFAYLKKEHGEVMIEQADGPGRHWITGELVRPFGRGINLQWRVKDLEALYENILSKEPSSIYLKLESKNYKCGEKTVVQRQFIVQDPDGYLLRFCDS